MSDTNEPIHRNIPVEEVLPADIVGVVNHRGQFYIRNHVVGVEHNPDDTTTLLYENCETAETLGNHEMVHVLRAPAGETMINNDINWAGIAVRLAQAGGAYHYLTTAERDALDDACSLYVPGFQVGRHASEFPFQHRVWVGRVYTGPSS